MIQDLNSKELVEIVYEHRVQLNKQREQLDETNKMLSLLIAKVNEAKHTTSLRFIKRLSILNEIVQITDDYARQSHK